MLTSNTLRIDRGPGSPIIDFRIQDGCVESRIVDSAHVENDSGWQRVTAEQLSSHLLSNSVVAQWLRRRMGIHRLLRACMQQPLSADTTERTNQIAA